MGLLLLVLLQVLWRYSVTLFPWAGCLVQWLHSAACFVSQVVQCELCGCQRQTRTGCLILLTLKAVPARCAAVSAVASAVALQCHILFLGSMPCALASFCCLLCFPSRAM